MSQFIEMIHGCKHVPLNKVARFSKTSITPTSGTVYTLFSFPAFDNDCTPEVVDGSDIKSSKIKLEEDVILYNKLNVRLSRVWNIEKLSTYNNICSSEFMPIKVMGNDVILKSFLYRVLCSDYVTKKMVACSTGTSNSQKRIAPTSLLNLGIPVPTLEQQNQFVSIAQQADKSKFGDFKSQFIEMFGNPVTNTKGWKTAKIKDVAPEIPSKEQLSGKIWLLNLDMIESNTGRVIKKVYEDVENALSVQSFDEGNVLFSKLRPYLNKVVIPDEPGMATTELVPLRPEPSKLHKVFLSHLLRGNQFVNYANDIAGGTKMPRMPLTELRNFDCILPPMGKQLEFVFIAEQVDKSKSVIQKAMVYLNDIHSDILRRTA